jgi:hypothetical protein
VVENSNILPRYTVTTCTSVRGNKRWFKYYRDYLCVNKSQFVPVIFEPPCISASYAVLKKMILSFVRHYDSEGNDDMMGGGHSTNETEINAW